MRSVLAAALALSCTVVAAQEDAQREVGRGLASWYGPGFHGRPTASGEKFDMDQLTAAHRTLPFGTIVRVQSLVNGRTVDVRINDRGPHIGKRVIDLSRAAAHALGLIEARTGIKQVVISVPAKD
jgi:rare lipoprotein A